MAQIHKVQDMRAADSTLQRLQLHTRRHLFPRRHDSQVSLGLLCCTHPVSHRIPSLPSRLSHRAHLFLFSRFFILYKVLRGRQSKWPCVERDCFPVSLRYVIGFMHGSNAWILSQPDLR